MARVPRRRAGFVSGVVGMLLASGLVALGQEPPGPVAVLATGDAAPGVLGATFQGFGVPAVDDDGRLAFRGMLTPGAGGVTSATDTGIWGPDGAEELTLIAREGGAAPGTTATFASFGDPVLSGDRVAFVANLQPGTGVTRTTSTGIWSTAGGTLALVARRGSPAPGVARATFSKFLSVALPDAGGVVFLAKLKGAKPPFDVGVWAADDAGDLSLLLLESDRTSVRGVAKPITKIQFLPAVQVVGGQTRHFTGGADFVAHVKYKDRTQGVVAFNRDLLFEDEFRGGFDPAWTIVRADAGSYATGAEELDLRLSAGDLHESNNTARNVFLIDTPTTGDFRAVLEVSSFVPSNRSFPQLDLLAWDGDDDHVRAGYGNFGGPGVELGVESGAEFSSDVNGHRLGAGRFWLMLLKVADEYSLFTSTDGQAFEQVIGSRTYGDGSPAKVGFVAMSDPAETDHALVDSFRVEPTARSVIAGGDAAPGVAGARFKTFGSPILSGAGHVGFRATLARGPGVTKANDSGIWQATAAGPPALVAREGGAAPSVPGGVFSTFSEPVNRGDDAVAFLAKLKPRAGGVTAADATGIWSSANGTLSLVARQGAAAPGTAAGTTFRAFLSLALPETGGPVFVAALAGAGVTQANDVGIWGTDAAGVVTLQLREGDAVSVGDATKTLATFQFLTALPVVPGQTRGFDGSGELLLRAVFTDGTEALLRIAR